MTIHERIMIAGTTMAVIRADKYLEKLWADNQADWYAHRPRNPKHAK